MNKHKMSKKLLATIMTFAMLITMFPSGVFAQDSGNGYQNGEIVSGTVTNTENGVTVNKYVTKDGDKYNLTLEGYASNQLTTTSTSTPLDIVLVLDVSGSMDDEFIGEVTTYSPVYNVDSDSSYYIHMGGNRYRSVEPSRNHEGKWYYFSDWDIKYVQPKTSEEDTTQGHVQFYVAETTAAKDKMQGLKDAVNGFITEVNTKNSDIPDNDPKHQISIVKFADNSYAGRIGDDKLPRSDYNYTQVVKDFTSDASALSTAINGLDAGGATAADFGFDLAKDVFAGNDNNNWNQLKGAREDSKKVVVFFTDGSPNHSNGFSKKIADDAINYAHDLKKAGVTVYSVGVFEDAGNQIDRYMNAVSSNYPDATSYDNRGEQKSDKYYSIASSPEDLNQIFEGIAEDVTTGDLEVNPDAEATLEDTLSQYFNLPADIDEDQVEVKYAPATDYDPEKGFTFGALEAVPSEGNNIRKEINEETENVKVTGFDYKKYAASYEKQDDGTYKVSGGKLVVTFEIEVDENACLLDPVENGQYPTNNTDNSKAKLAYKANEQAEENNAVIALDKSPEVYFDNTKFDANGTDVTVQVYLDGKKIDPDQYVTLTRKTGANDNWTYFNRVDKTDNVLTYDFNYNTDPESGFNCVDINVALNDDYKDDIVLQGVHSYQSYGKGGTNNVIPESNGTYTVDNIASDGKDDTVDCTIYLRTKYSAEYYVNGQKQSGDLTDNTVYLEKYDVAEPTDDTGYPENRGDAEWMDWMNESYKTSITLKELPTVSGSVVDGWYLGDDTNKAQSPVSVVDNKAKAEDSVFKFNATTAKLYNITINYVDDKKQQLQDSKTINDLKDDTEKTFDVSTEEGADIPQIIEKDGKQYVFNRLTEGDWTVTIDGANEEITAEYLLDSDKDGTPDAYEATVTYKVENGTWSDGTTADKIADFVIKEFNPDTNTWIDTNATLSDTIPTAKADTGYDQSTGKWDATIDETTKVTGDVTYTFTFAQQKYAVTIKYQNEDGDPIKADFTDKADIVNSDYSYAVSEDETGDVPFIIKDGDTQYVYDRLAQDSDPLSGTLDGNKTITAVYAVDENENKIPDKYEVTVTYKVVNGTWSDDETKNITQDFVIAEFDGSKWNAKEQTLGSTIPQGMKANDGYDQNSGKWDQDIKAETKVTEDVTYTYEFTEQKYTLTYDANGGTYGDDKTAAEATGLTAKEYILWDENNETNDQEPTDGTTKLPTHAQATVDGKEVKVLFAGWTLNDNDEAIYSAGDTPKYATKVDLQGDTTVYAVWSYDKNGNGTPDVKEDLYTLTYNATSGYYGEATDEKTTAVAENLLGGMKYDLWTKDNTGTKPTDGTEAWPQHADVTPEGESEPVAVEMVGWTTNEELAKTIYGRDSASVPQIYYNVPIEKANVTVYAVWGYDENNNGTPDITEKGATLTYNATSGTYSDGSKEASATKLLPRTYDLWNLNDEDQVIGQQPDNKELALPTHAKVAALPGSVIAQEGTECAVVFMGWTETEPKDWPTADTASITGNDKANYIYAAGEEYPTLSKNVELAGDQTVYAVWGYDENGDGIADAQQIVITPADITIYQGGEGYEGVVEGENGANIGENHEGLPEPGYYLILPYQLDEELEGADNTINLSGKLHLHYTNAAGKDARDWDLALYNESAGTDGNKVNVDKNHDGKIEAGEFYYVYQLKQSEGNNYPVRLEIKDGDTFKTTDDFDFAIDSLYETYPMRLYNTPDLDRELVTAQIKVNGNWTDVNDESVLGAGTVRGIARGFGTLTIRGTVDEEPVTAIGTEAPTDNVTQITAVESGTEKNVYNVNGSGIPVIDQDAVQFLADTIVDPEGTSTAQLKEAAQAENTAITDDYTFDFSYLDLVDTSNGNAYVTLADEDNMSVDLYWPYPEDMDKSEPVYIVHYDGLDRDFNGANLDDELKKDDVSVNVYSADSDEFTLTDTGKGYKITTSTFSPFAIVYKQEQSVTPDPGPGGGGDDDRPGLNLEDHYSYIVGYPEDYRTGEATDDESLWPVKPQGKITRAEVATIFYRLLNNETRTENWTTSNNFTDVDADDWYNTPISTLSSMGIIVGYNDGSFQPNAPITRAEFAAIAVRFYQNNDVNYEEGLFTDIDGSEWFADAIAAAYEHGIIGGYVDGSFQPNNQITRAEAAAIVNRTTDRFPDKDHLLDAAEMRTWPDNANPDVWYYADIQEATNSHEYYKMDDPDGEEGDQIEQWTERGEDVDWDAVEAYQESVH